MAGHRIAVPGAAAQFSLWGGQENTTRPASAWPFPWVAPGVAMSALIAGAPPPLSDPTARVRAMHYRHSLSLEPVWEELLKTSGRALYIWWGGNAVPNTGGPFAFVRAVWLAADGKESVERVRLIRAATCEAAVRATLEWFDKSVRYAEAPTSSSD